MFSIKYNIIVKCVHINIQNNAEVDVSDKIYFNTFEAVYKAVILKTERSPSTGKALLSGWAVVQEDIYGRFVPHGVKPETLTILPYCRCQTAYTVLFKEVFFLNYSLIKYSSVTEVPRKTEKRMLNLLRPSIYLWKLNF